MSKIKADLYRIFEEPAKAGKLGKYINNFIVILILLNVLAIILATEKSLQAKFGLVFDIFELLSVIIFSIEYILRLTVCTENPKFHGAIKGRVRYAFTFYALIDLLAVIPFYLPRVLRIDLRFIRLIRLFRIVRILKLARYSISLRVISGVIRNKKDDLIIVIGIIILLIVISSCLMYMVENDVQPDKFTSILSTMWWSIATISTVGYGDIYPITGLGKLLASIIAILGIGFFALPTAILGSGFMEEIGRQKEGVKRCPHCGGEL